MEISPELFILISVLGTITLLEFAESGRIFKDGQLRSCLDLLKKVTTLEDFNENFAQQFIQLSQERASNDLLSVCLNTRTDPVNDVRELKNIIEVGMESDVCSFTFVHDYLGRYHDERFLSTKHGLRNVFDFYVKKVIALCKGVLLDRVTLVKKDADFPYLMDTIKNLIFDVTDGIGSFDAQFYWPRRQVNNIPYVTIGDRLEGLILSEEIMANFKNVPTISMEHPDDVLKNLDRIRWSCQHLSVYQRDILYTIATLSEKGYTEPVPSLDLPHNSDLFWWIITAQMCEIVKLVVSNEAPRNSPLELTFSSRQENLKEIEFKSFEFSPSMTRKIVYLKEDINDARGICDPVSDLLNRFLRRTTSCPRHNGVVRAGVIDSIVGRFITEKFLKLLGRYLGTTVELS